MTYSPLANGARSLAWPGRPARTPVTPGTDDVLTAVPGAYEADDADRERGKAVKPGN